MRARRWRKSLSFIGDEIVNKPFLMAIWQYLPKGLGLSLAIPLKGIGPIDIFSTCANDICIRLFITALFALAREGGKHCFHQRQSG